MSRIVLYLLTGKLLIFLIQKARPHYHIPRFLEELFNCDLCLGVWVYFFLSFFFVVTYFDEYFYFTIFSEMLTGMVSSFIMHLVSIGWKDKFGTVIVETTDY